MIKLYWNKKIYNITDCVEPNIEFTKRCDMAFGSGAFDMELDNNDFSFAHNNLPPYTLIEIDNVKYLCTSQCNLVVPRKDIYIHNVTLSSLDTILPCFNIGSKYFSKSTSYGLDSKKIDILFDIATNRITSNYKIEWDSDFDKTIFNKQIEHQFGAGTTLWDALVEICNYYNYRPYVKNVKYTNSSYIETINNNEYADDKVVITVSFLNLTNPSTISIIKRDVVTQEIKSQKQDDYCKYLETEATNVIDTNTPTKVYGLSVTSDEVTLTQDSMYLRLPTKIDSIKSIWFKAYIPNPTLKISGNFELLESQNEMSYDNVISKYRAVETILTDYMKDYLIGIPISSLKFNTQMKSSYIQVTSVSASLNYYINATKYLLEESQWSLLTEYQRLACAYYKNGSDGIYNMFGYMDTGFPIVNWVLEQPTFIKKILNDTQVNAEVYINNVRYEYLLQFNGGSTNASYNPSNYTFDVEYYPITNPLLVVEKDESIDSPHQAENELCYKKISRSYGNSANKIDFDRLVESMDRNNISLGAIERSVEIDGNSLSFDITNVPLKVIYDYDTFYLLCYTLNITNSSKTYTLYLVRDYSAIASAIGISTQFNALKNPIDKEIERPINFIGTISSALSTSDKYGMIITPKNCTSGIIRAVVMQYGKYYVFYAEAIDSYALDTYTNGVLNNRVDMYDFPYANSDNESDSYNVKLIKFLRDLTLEESYKMPQNNLVLGTDYEVLYSFDKNVYKDKREKLTFTIQLTNTSYTED